LPFVFLPVGTSVHSTTMRATLRPNRFRICFGVADASSIASCRSAAIASVSLPPSSSTSAATPSRCAV
jgi:hypothetical protein